MIGPQTRSSTSALPFRQNSLSSAISMTSLNRALALTFTVATVALRSLILDTFSMCDEQGRARFLLQLPGIRGAAQRLRFGLKVRSFQVPVSTASSGNLQGPIGAQSLASLFVGSSRSSSQGPTPVQQRLAAAGSRRGRPVPAAAGWRTTMGCPSLRCRRTSAASLPGA